MTPLFCELIMYPKNKIEKVKKLIYGYIDKVDKTGKNTKRYKDLFKSMNDKEFSKYIDNILNNDNEHFRLEYVPYYNEPTLKDVLNGLKYLGIPTKEYVTLVEDDGTKITSENKVSVGWVDVRRMQQVISKKNSYSLSINERNLKKGTVSGGSKVGIMSDSETNALLSIGLDITVKELMTGRSDDQQVKNAMSRSIQEKNTVSLDEVMKDSIPTEKTTLMTLNTFLLGAGLASDLISQDNDIIMTSELYKKIDKIKKGEKK